MQPFKLSSQQFPVISDCDENNICICEISDNFKPFNELHTRQILDSLNSKPLLHSTFQACCHHQLGVYYYNQDDLIKALSYYKKAEQLRSKFEDGLLWRTQLNIGSTYYELNDYQLAIKYLEKAQFSNGLKEDYERLNILKDLGNCYALLGDFEKGIEFGKLSIESKGNIDIEEMNHGRNDLAANLIETNENSQIELAIRNSKIIIKQAKDQENKIMAHNNVGRAYTELKIFNKALDFFKNALNLSKNDTLDYAIILNNIASLHMVKNVDEADYFAARDTLNESLRLCRQYFISEYNYDYAMPLENLGDVYTALRQFDKALLHYQKALINLTNNFRTDDLFQNPNPKDTTLFIYSNPDMIRVLHLKATAVYQFYKQNQNLKYLNLANQTYQTAFDFHNQLQKEISTENSRLFQAKNIVPYIENALKVAYELQQKDQPVGAAAFRFIEKNKATVLLQSMNEADALQFANLPDSLLTQEKDLKIAITYHNKQLNEAIEYEETTEIERLDKILFEEKQEYSQLINNLENNYSDYYRLKYQQNQTQLKDVQQSLDDQTALIEYFVGDSAIYVLSILKEYSHLYQIKKPGNWKQMINDFRKSITDTNGDLPELFVENATTLYRLLLNEPLCDMSEDITQLQIIPDAELNYIPFEILLTSSVNRTNIEYKKLPYLLNQKSIGYAYSAALLLENKQSLATPKTWGYGAYAPIYYPNDSIFEDLAVARDTVISLANSLNGQAVINEQAILPSFINNTNSYKILHLAMHGILNDKNPLSSYLAFTKNTTKKDTFKLHAYDLYNQKINTELTILHACNTGSGELQKGEGVMSLSRAFTYAGCPSLVMSLWSIPEKATSEITSSFIKHLKNGLPKDEALQKAKLAYLQNQPERLASPAYWAGLVATGNLKPINFD